MTVNLENFNFTTASIVQSISELLYVNREFGMDVQAELAQAINVLDQTECASIADALALIDFGRRLMQHATTRTLDPLELHNIHSVADWYTGLAVMFLARMQTRMSIGPGGVTVH